VNLVQAVPRIHIGLETFFSWYMIPVFDEHNTVQGIYIPNFDCTNTIIAERRMRTLRELSHHMIMSSDIDDFLAQSVSALSANETDVPLLVVYK